jgi:hypothetical protein
MAMPLLSVSGVDVSLTVRTKQATRLDEARPRGAVGIRRLWQRLDETLQPRPER